MIVTDSNKLYLNSEQEKIRRWEEIRLRQHRILAEVENTTPAHYEHIMR